MKSIYETAGGIYQRQGDYKLPNLKLLSEEEKFIGVWGQRYQRHLRQNHCILYYNLLTAGTLNEHSTEVDQRAESMFQAIVKLLSEKEYVTERLKSISPMEWVQKMNNIRNRATEIVNAEVIFM